MATYLNARFLIGNGQIDLDSPSVVIRAMLTTSSYAPSAANHTNVSHITNELTGGNYSRKTLTGKTVTSNAGENNAYFSADPITWPAINAGTIGYVVFYVQIGGDDSTPLDDILLCYTYAGGLVTNGGDIVLNFQNSIIRF